MDNIFSIKKWQTLVVCLCFLSVAFGNTKVKINEKVNLPNWEEPSGMSATDLSLGVGEIDRSGWGHYSPNERAYFNEVLPSVFKRTLVLDSIEGDRGIKWIFTGPREGFYIEVAQNKLSFYHQYYDSFGFNEGLEKLPGYPQSKADTIAITADVNIKAITVEMNHKLELLVSLNGKEVIRQTFIEDIRRNQIHLTGMEGSLSSRILEPETLEAQVKVNPKATFQKMLGWGGIGTPTAYNELSEAGKVKWWEYINEYNLLCQREYPVGRLLHKNLDNWDDLSFAKAHYYGDNFPNGEVSDFEYNEKIQELGGFVMLEFWDFPSWIGNSEKEYARAMVGYCEEAVKKTGKAPRIVGIQNEVPMPEENVKKFVPELRKELDKAGFNDVEIHMANAGRVNLALQRVGNYTKNPEVWDCIDYGATNMYDYQGYFTNPDGFDSQLLLWDSKVNTKPFLSTELCINDKRYQTDSYRIALTMGQLYDKNLTLTNAVLIAYCWTILNVEQPSYGASRSLFVSSPENGFMPVPSSNQLRVFGAYSRRIKEGMTRVDVENSNNDLKIVAFKGANNLGTLVVLNRSVHPVNLEIDWKGIRFSEIEVVDPYSPNVVKPFEGDIVKVQPGAFVTITNVALNQSN
ncbi:glycoside hydrolase family 30 beta sandwich domain-containing protein [Maribellus sediminis]|uniref:glycoside hydrolase family 30 beta sandwich domain-containing protein n=1 Tax=Maribellus sediminis TaxID=2696285 RepID=UPI0014322A62|nr:glycoside hydrolase family 30 beta sandwich domain-containing protein [Maribellus sediminis]